MGGLLRLYERTPDAFAYTAGLAAVGVAYPALLAGSGALPAPSELQPFLAAGILLGFVVDRSLGDGWLVALVEGDLLADGFDSFRRRLAPYDPSGTLDGSGTAEAGGAGVGGDDDDSGAGWWTLVSLGSTLGFSSVVQFTAPWFVGLVLGTIWMIVAVRFVRLCSPLTEGMRRPPRGAPAGDTDRFE